jgi:hypothetical protein
MYVLVSSISAINSDFCLNLDASLAGKSIQSALIGGSCLAFTSAVLDIGGNTTRVDNGKEYYAYTTEKKPAN